MELNAEKVKKALECCAMGNCAECSYSGADCENEMSEDALALINSQEQRIKELTAENERLTRLANLRQRDLDNANDLLFKAEDEIERSRADTVRKMQERLKADAVTIQDHTGKLGVVVGVGNIDDVAREMLEGEK